jgi:hypothetical protein
MKKPSIPSYRRPAGAPRRAPRTRAEAAVELVRLEFDAARLQREVDQAERRADVARAEMEIGTRRIDGLLRRLTFRKDVT